MPKRRENCFKFLAGVCERGDSCKFYHDKQAARYIKKNVPGGPQVILASLILMRRL